MSRVVNFLNVGFYLLNESLIDKKEINLSQNRKLINTYLILKRAFLPITQYWIYFIFHALYAN